MPVYGGKRATRKYPNRTDEPFFIRRDLEKGKVRPTRRMISMKSIDPEGFRWKVRNTPIQVVERQLGFTIRAWTARRAEEFQRPIDVLDWGCENGRAILDLEHALGEKVNAFGYGKENYPEWNENPRVNFIQETKEEMFRFFKKKQFDLIFSHSGLHHLRKDTPLELPRYLRKLSRKLAPEGLIVFSPFWDEKEYAGIMLSKSSEKRERGIQALYQGIIDPTKKEFHVIFHENLMVVERLP